MLISDLTPFGKLFTIIKCDGLEEVPWYFGKPLIKVSVNTFG